VVVNNVTIHNAADGISITGPSSSTGSSGFSVIDGCHIQGITNTGINMVSGAATISHTVISGCATGVGAQSGSSAHLTGNIITNNSTALQGPGTFTSAGNNSLAGNTAQGVNPTLVGLK
jgi:hypothetical protein